MHPGFQELLSEAKAAAATQQPAKAERLLRQLLAMDPTSLEAHMVLAGTLLGENRVEEAAEFAQRAIELNPNAGPPHFHLGQCRLRQGRVQEAADEMEIAVSLSPSIAPMHFVLGLASNRAGRGQRAEECFRRAIQIDPSAAPSYAELGQILLAKGDPAGAIQAFQRAADLQPGSARGQFLLGRALIEGERFAEGENRLRTAMRLDPRSPEAYVLLARAFQQQGFFSEAETVLGDLSSHQDDESQGFFLRMTGRKVTREDLPLLERMERTMEQLNPGPQRMVSYGLGKAFDDLGEFERAMRHFDAANRLSQERAESMGKTFDPAAMERMVSSTIARYPSAPVGVGDPSDRPIFIVGMARSGTTLLEQILSSHPAIAAAGELGTWVALSDEKFDPTEVAQSLLQKLEAASPHASRVTVKTPQNYMVLGQILSVFPDCRIVHCRRNAIDTCLSIYTTSFMSGPEFAHNRESLVAAHRQYRRIMDHWQSVLPADRVISIDYEQLISDREPVLRGLLEFLGLEWSDQVMHHEGNKHAISTPSLWQARQPIFEKSVGRWKNYAPWLGPLLELQDGP